MNNVRVYPLTFASGATSTGSQYVGNVRNVHLYHSGTTAWNADLGNVDLYLVGSIGTETVTTALTNFRVQSALIQTDISGGCYQWPVTLGVGGIPRYSVEFGTAVTGSATNKIYLVVGD